MMAGPFPPRPTIWTDPEELGGVEAQHVEPWQTELFLNGAPVQNGAQEYVIKPQSPKIVRLNIKGSLG